nr:insulinase family protein [Larsenimonas salina]
MSSRVTQLRSTRIAALLSLWLGCTAAAHADAIHKSPNDPREYRAFTLDNGVHVITVHDPNAERAAVAMNVDVGSKEDPNARPGLAHFTEHMLFLGTDAHPTPDGFDAFISQHGGDNNAYTSLTDTNYHATIEPDALEPLLARFGEFFAAPRLDADHVDRERHAVNAEYQMRRHDDHARMRDVLSQRMNPEHPASRFTIGSLDTLSGPPSELRGAVERFFTRYYRGKNMTLAISGPQPSHRLEQWARHYFSAIRKASPQHLDDTRTPLPSLMAENALPQALRVKTLEQQRQVRFLFPIQDPTQSPTDNAVSYIASLIGDEGPGSLLAALKARGWANALSAGTVSSDGTNAFFSVRVALTAEGARHIAHIQASMFEVIQRIEHSGLDRWRLNEQRRLTDQQFTFESLPSPSALVGYLSSAAGTYTDKNLRRGPYITGDFNAPRLRAVLARLRPDRLLRIYSGPEVDGDRQSPWFDTRYQVVQAAHWQKADALSGLSLPMPNPYIATDLTQQALETTPPTQLSTPEGMTAWYHGTTRFSTPKSSWHLSLQSPLTSQSARGQMATTLLSQWLIDSLGRTLYQASLAGQSIGAYAHARGLTIQVEGWRDRQDVILGTLIHQLKQGELTDTDIARLKQNLLDGFESQAQAPAYQQLQQRMTQTGLSPAFSTDEQKAALSALTAEDLRAFRIQFLERLHLDALTVGNLTRPQAEHTLGMIQKRLRPTLGSNAIPSLAAMRPTQAQPPWSVPVKDPNHAALTYLVWPDANDTSRAAAAVLGAWLESPFYSTLRTREQLGYLVSAGYQPLIDVPRLAFVVQSPETSGIDLSHRIDRFIDAQTPPATPAELAPFKQSVIHALKQPALTLSELANRHWQAQAFGQLGHDPRTRLIDAVNALTPATLQHEWSQVVREPAFKLVADPAGSNTKLQTPPPPAWAAIDVIPEAPSKTREITETAHEAALNITSP